MIPPALATLFTKPLVRYGLPVVAIVIAVIAFRWWLSDVKENAAREAVQAERQEQAVEVINRMEKADAARSEVRDPGSRAKYDQCMLSATNPGACKRFLPE